MTTITAIPTKLSHLTQVALNYFPDTDVRIRENPVSLGAQLLNSIAFQMEGQNTRLTRELRAFNMSDMPMNIDNTGVYYATLVPSDFSLPIDDQGNLLPPTFIKGRLLETSVSLIDLIPYDDTLPVPTRISLDPTLKSVVLSNPQIVNTIGNGAPQSFTPGVLPLPNYLTFSIQDMGPITVAFTISITGELDPPAIWPQDIQSKNEVLIISDDGFYHTNSVWSSINQIDITGLPIGCSCVCYSLPVGLSVEPDLDRPFTHFAYRNTTFPRHWQLQDLVLSEQYQRNRFAKHETYQVYHLPTRMMDIAVEPNTNGLFLTDGTSLYYIDRRTPMPDHLIETGVTKEPAFGLNVWYDYNNIGNTQYAYVSAIPMSTASSVTQYRYVVQDPNGTVFVLLPTGILQQYTGSTGWTQGTPTAVSFPLTLIGTYIISLEMLSGSFNAKTVDTFPYSNLAITPLGTLDLASLVPSIQGIAFDAYDKLWLWTGEFAVPVKLSYDAYLWDPSTRTIYATDKYYALILRLNDN